MQTEKLSATNKRRDCKEDLSNQDISNKTQREGKFQSCQLGHFSQNERNEQEKKKKVSCITYHCHPAKSKSASYVEFLFPPSCHL